MVIEEVIEFLSQVPPFQFLNENELRSVAGSALMKFYPKGTKILHQDGAPSEYFNVIKKGAVKVFMKAGDEEEVIVDYRGEGDAFGFLSIVGGDKSRANVIAIEDTICYLIERETVIKLLDSHPAFTEFFLKSVLNKYIDKTCKEMHNKSLMHGGGDKLLFTTPVGELRTRDAVTASQEITIQDAAQLMTVRKISCLVLVEPDGVPVGIVTDRDLRDKVVAKGREVLDPVKCIMSVSLIKVEAKDHCFEALLRMIRFNIHHLLVVDQGKLKGVVTNHDLMMLQGAAPYL